MKKLVLIYVAFLMFFSACGEEIQPINDGSLLFDGGHSADGGSVRDGGSIVDGGVLDDGGNKDDGGTTEDGGLPEDGGVSSDGGDVLDGGPAADGGLWWPDGGTVADGGFSEDGGNQTDGGMNEDGGLIDGGDTEDGGQAIEDGGIDGGVILDGGSCSRLEVSVEEDITLDEQIGDGYARTPYIAVNAAGQPRIVYECADNDATNCVLDWSSEIRYIEKNADGWSNVSVIAGHTPKILLDGEENAHIVYNAFSPRGRCFDRWKKTNSNGIWVYDQLFCDPDGETGPHSEVFDHHDKMHMVYSDGYNTTIEYATTNSMEEWAVQTINDEGYLRDPVLVLGKNDSLHIVFLRMVNGSDFRPEIRYTTNESGDWLTTTLVPEPANFFGFFSDTNRSCHLLYYVRDLDSGRAINHYLMEEQGGGWVAKEIDDRASLPSLVAQNGIVYAIYYNDDGESLGLRFTTNLSGKWEKGGVFMAGAVVRALSVDLTGKLHFVYYRIKESSRVYSMHYARIRVNFVDSNCGS